MKTFKEFIQEENTTRPKKMHEILNKSQIRALHKHPSFNTYVNSYDHPDIYGKEESGFDQGPGKTRSVVLTNSSNKHKMHVTITHRGKILGHTIYRKSDKPHPDAKGQWDLVKSKDGA